MKKKKSTSDKLSSLRKEAEEKLAPKPPLIECLSEAQIRKLAHELQVHQIELEMQNEELRASQVQLEESRDKYSSLYDFAPIGYVTLDARGIIKETNLTFAAQAGVERGRLINSPIVQFIHEVDRPLFFHFLRKIFECREGRTVQVRFKAPNNIEFFVLLDGILVDAFGIGKSCLAAVTDVTNLKRTEKALQKEIAISKGISDLSEALLDEEPDINAIAGMVLDQALKLTGSKHGFVSGIDSGSHDNVAHILAHKLDDGCKVSHERHMIVFTRGEKGFVGLHVHALNTREGFFTNFPQRHPAYQGRYPTGHIPIERFLSVPAVSGEKLLGQISLANSERDYTTLDLEVVKRLAGFFTLAVQKKQWQNELERHHESLEELVEKRTAELELANENLRMEMEERIRAEEELFKAQRMESMGLMASGIAHDFNNLLTGFASKIVQARWAVDNRDTVLQKLKEAESLLVHARNMSRQLLIFSKGGELLKKCSSVEGLLRETPKFFLSDPSIQCDFSISRDLWQVEMDSVQMRQAFANIAINAQESKPKDGKLKITAENILLKEKEIPALKGGRYVKISFKDRGHGIPKEIQPKIFDIFFTTKEKGSGLGLATVYAIIKKHEGHLEVDSIPGEGAVFTVYLPASGGEDK